MLLAFVPEASMGTAIEMWQAYTAGRTVITISPLELNWTVRFLSHEIYATVEAFEDALCVWRLRPPLARDSCPARRALLADRAVRHVDIAPTASLRMLDRAVTDLCVACAS